MKKLIVRGVTSNPNRSIYVHPSVKRYDFFSYCYYVEYLGQRMPIEKLERNSVDKENEVFIPEYMAKKLSVRLGDKIAIGTGLFKKPNTDYMSLYEKDPKRFIKFFNKRNPSEKKKILKELLEHDIVNEKVVRWLDGHEPDLVREAGFGI